MAEGARGGGSRFVAIALVSACVAAIGGTRSEAQSDGVPWTGSNGITETVAQIMARPEKIGMGASTGDDEFRNSRLRQNRRGLPQ